MDIEAHCNFLTSSLYVSLYVSLSLSLNSLMPALLPPLALFHLLRPSLSCHVLSCPSCHYLGVAGWRAGCCCCCRRCYWLLLLLADGRGPQYGAPHNRYQLARAPRRRLHWCVYSQCALVCVRACVESIKSMACSTQWSSNELDQNHRIKFNSISCHHLGVCTSVGGLDQRELSAFF